MIGVISEDENHNKIFKPMAGATLGQGVPLGAWCSFEKDVAPSNNWLMAGTTFDATIYPALNLYLGTNKVPSRYDHNRPSKKMPINGTDSIPFSLTTTNAEVPYDGIINFGYNISHGRIFYINDEIRAISGNSGSSGNTSTVEVKKGDMVRVDLTLDLTASYNYAIWFTHPLFIKATPIASDTDQQAILAQIQAYNTYSTEETLTGKTWIENGVEKPTYRRCYFGLNIPFTNQENWQSLGITAPLNVDSIKKGICYGTDVTAPYSAHDIPFCNCLVAIGNNNTLFRWNTLNAGVIHSVVIEYTKTTD